MLCLSLVLTVANNSGLNVALPTLVREIGATQAQLQWIIDIYVLIAGSSWSLARWPIGTGASVHSLVA